MKDKATWLIALKNSQRSFSTILYPMELTMIVVKIVEWYLIVSLVSGIALAIYIQGWRDGYRWPNWTQHEC